MGAGWIVSGGVAAGRGRGRDAYAGVEARGRVQVSRATAPPPPLLPGPLAAPGRHPDAGSAGQAGGGGWRLRPGPGPAPAPSWAAAPGTCGGRRSSASAGLRGSGRASG